MSVMGPETASESYKCTLREVVEGKLFQYFTLELAKQTELQIERLEGMKSENKGLISRLRLYLSDSTKKTSLMLRTAVLLSNHEIGAFGLGGNKLQIEV